MLNIITYKERSTWTIIIELNTRTMQENILSEKLHYPRSYSEY